MNNAEKFQETFGIYATEMWAMPESDFLNWLNSLHDAKASNTTDLISRQDAIKALQNMPTAEALKAISEMPSVDASLMQDKRKIDASSDLISRQAAIDALREAENHAFNSFYKGLVKAHKIIADIPSAQPEDYTAMKQEFIRMAGYIDMLLVCSDEQKETLLGFISRLAEYMPWTERD